MSDESVYQPKVNLRRHKRDFRGIEYSICKWGDADAPMLVYLHGWADTGSTFQFVIDELQQNWHVIAPDWRGFGRSSHTGDSYWFPDYLADLYAILEHYSPDRAVRLVGHSMGGNIGSLYAGTWPERISAFINIEGFGLPDTAPDEAPNRYRQWVDALMQPPRFVNYSDYSSLALRIRKRSPAISHPMSEFVAREWGSEDSDGKIHLRADPAHKLPNPVLYRRKEVEACWSRISADTLLVHGEDSTFASNIGGLSAIRIANARDVCIPGCGHMLHFEAPGTLAGVIEDFLQKTL